MDLTRTIYNTAMKTLFFVAISPLLPAIGLMWAIALLENDEASRPTSAPPETFSTTNVFSSDSQLGLA